MGKKDKDRAELERSIKRYEQMASEDLIKYLASGTTKQGQNAVRIVLKSRGIQP